MVNSPTPLNDLTVAIAGGGIGGLSAAIALTLKGADVTVFEQAPELAEIGAGLQVLPSATRVLNAFGLKNHLAEIGRIPENMSFRQAKTGRIVLSAEAIRSQEPDAEHYQVHRADLHHMLYQRALELGVSIELNAVALGTRQHANKAALIVSDGRELQADVLIGADGVKSAIRQSLFGADEPVFTGHLAYRMMVDANKLSHAIEPRVVLGPDSHVVMYPLRDGKIINVIAQQRSESWVEESWTTRADVSELKAFYENWDPIIEELLDNATECYKWAMYTRPAMSAWSRDNVVLIGDACHPTLPNLGAGAAMAIEDAYVLADLLEKHRADIPAGLARLHQLRIKRCTRIQETSKKNAAFFHIQNPLERYFKYVGASAVSRFCPALIRRRLDWLRGYDARQEIS